MSEIIEFSWMHSTFNTSLDLRMDSLDFRGVRRCRIWFGNGAELHASVLLHHHRHRQDERQLSAGRPHARLTFEVGEYHRLFLFLRDHSFYMRRTSVKLVVMNRPLPNLLPSLQPAPAIPCR